MDRLLLACETCNRASTTRLLRVEGNSVITTRCHHNRGVCGYGVALALWTNEFV